MIRSGGRGMVSGSCFQIRCEQPQIEEVAIAPGDTAGPHCSGYGGEVGTRDRTAGRGVVGRVGEGERGGGGARGESKLWVRPSPGRRRSCCEIISQKLATCLRLGCVTRAAQGPLLGRAQEQGAVPPGRAP